MTLLIVGLVAIRLFELSGSWHLVAGGVWSLAIAGLAPGGHLEMR